MYRLSPFTYLLEGFLTVATHGQPVRCGSNEFTRFPSPPGQSCSSYTQIFISQLGGYVQNGTNGLCEFCQYANGDEFARGFRVYYNDKWMDFYVFLSFCIFNFAVVFLSTWLYLGGLKTMKNKVSPAARKQRKARKMANGRV